MGKDISEFEDSVPMYVMTNEQQINGATVLIYDNVIQEFACQKNTSLYILPSSIHEVILLPDDGQLEPANLAEMVREINKHDVAATEKLSDTIYYYDTESHQISCIR